MKNPFEITFGHREGLAVNRSLKLDAKYIKKGGNEIK